MNMWIRFGYLKRYITCSTCSLSLWRVYVQRMIFDRYPSKLLTRWYQDIKGVTTNFQNLQITTTLI